VRSEQWRTLWVPLAVTGFVVALASPAVAVPGDLDASAPIATTSHSTSRCSKMSSYSRQAGRGRSTASTGVSRAIS
jgi:hypothetical protein